MHSRPEPHELAPRPDLESVILFAFVLAIGFLAASALADFEPLELLRTHRHWPFSPLGAWVAAYLVAATALAALRAPRWLECIALPAILCATYVSTRGPSFGDHQSLVIIARTHDLWLSETLANLVWHVSSRLALPFEIVPPVFGALTGAAFLWVTWEPTLNARERFLRSAAWLATGVHLVFFKNYLENCSMGVVWIVLGLSAAMRFMEHGRARDLVVSSAWLAVAALFHGQAAALFPLVPVLCLLRASGAANRPDANGRPYVRALKQSLASLGVLAGVILCVLAVLKLAGFRLVEGNMYGGADGVPFVPFSRPADARWFRFSMFSRAHFELVTDAAWMAAPLFAAGLLAAPRLWRSAWWREPELARTGALCTASLGAFAFLFVWNFDLGYPRDYDLMVSLASAVLPWMALRALLGAGAGRDGARFAVSLVAVIVVAHFTWLTLTAHLR